MGDGLIERRFPKAARLSIALEPLNALEFVSVHRHDHEVIADIKERLGIGRRAHTSGIVDELEQGVAVSAEKLAILALEKFAQARPAHAGEQNRVGPAAAFAARDGNDD